MILLTHGSPYTRTTRKTIAGTSAIVTFAISAQATSNGTPLLIYRGVGGHSDATRWSSHNSRESSLSFLTSAQTRDNVASRTLTSPGYTDATKMTVENCVNFCNNKNFTYAGIEYGQECCKWRFSVVHSTLLFPISDILIIYRLGIRLWECHIEWGGDLLRFGL